MTVAVRARPIHSELAAIAERAQSSRRGSQFDLQSFRSNKAHELQVRARLRKTYQSPRPMAALSACMPHLIASHRSIHHRSTSGFPSPHLEKSTAPACAVAAA